MAKLFVLVACLLVASSATKLDDIFYHSIGLATLNDGKVVNINNVIDDNINEIRTALKTIDPAALPDVGFWHGHLTVGNLRQLSRIFRSSDCTMKYENKKVSVVINVGWNDISLGYNYDFKLWLIQRYGSIYGSISDLKINVGFEVDLSKYTLTLQHLKFTNVGKLEVKVHTSIMDWLYNLIAKIVVNIMKTPITKLIEQKTAMVLRQMLDNLNSRMPRSRPKFRFVDLVNVERKVNEYLIEYN